MTETSFAVSGALSDGHFTAACRQQQQGVERQVEQQQQQASVKVVEHPNPDGRPVDPISKLPVLFSKSTGPLRKSTRVDQTVLIPVGTHPDLIFGRQLG